MVQIKGVRLKLINDDPSWYRQRTTYPLACPDGVTRCVTFPNWKWVRWVPAFDPDAFTTGRFKRFVPTAWRFSQIFARSYDASAVMAEELIQDIERHHLHPFFTPANNNPPPPMREALLRVPRPPRPPWRKGTLSYVFKREARGHAGEDAWRAALHGYYRRQR